MNEKEESLLNSAKKGDLNKIEELIEEKFDLNKKDKSGNTALMLALINNKPEVAKKLLEAGADATIANNKGETPLICACYYYNDPDLIDILIKDKDIEYLNAINYLGDTALIAAIRKGNSEAAIKLLEAGADLKIRIGVKSPFEYAVDYGRTEVTKLIVKKGIDLNKLLKKSSIGNSFKIVSSFFEVGVDRNLHAYLNKKSLFKLLFEFEINRNKESYNPLNLIKLFLNNGYDFNSGDNIRLINKYLIIKDESKKLIEDFRKNPVDYFLNNNKKPEDLIELMCTKYNHKKTITKFVEYAGANQRLDLLYRAIIQKDYPKNLDDVLKDRSIIRKISKAAMNDNESDPRMILEILSKVKELNKGRYFITKDLQRAIDKYETDLHNLGFMSSKFDKLDFSNNPKRTSVDDSYIARCIKNGYTISVKQNENTKGAIVSIVSKDGREHSQKEFSSSSQQIGQLILDLAVNTLNLNTINGLLKKLKIRPEIAMNNLETPLVKSYIASTSGDENAKEIFKMCLLKTKNINAKTLGGQTLMHVVATSGEEEDIALMVLAGGDLNSIDNYGKTPKGFLNKKAYQVKTSNEIVNDKDLMNKIFEKYGITFVRQFIRNIDSELVKNPIFHDVSVNAHERYNLYKAISKEANASKDEQVRISMDKLSRTVLNAPESILLDNIKTQIGKIRIESLNKELNEKLESFSKKLATQSYGKTEVQSLD